MARSPATKSPSTIRCGRSPARSKVYGDAFQWPILFIANRDQIKDPDLIKPGWDLKVSRGVSSDEIGNAVKKAKDTPRYEPHTAPREKLPIDY